MKILTGSAPIVAVVCAFSLGATCALAQGPHTSGAQPAASFASHAPAPAAAAASATSTATRTLDLTACLSLARGQSPALLATLREEKAARWRYYQQRALFNPTVTATTYQKQQGSLPPLGTIIISSTKLTDEDVALNQTLYSFGHLEAGIHTRKYQSRAARSDSEDARQQLTFDVTKAFDDLLLARELIVIAKETVAQVQRQLQLARQSFETGLVARFDVVRARTQLANTQPQLIHAVQNERTSRQALLTAMGIDDDLDFQIQGSFDHRPVEHRFDDVLRIALSTRPDVRALTDRWKAARSAVREAQTSDNPTLSAQAGYDNSKGVHFPINKSIELDFYQVSLSVPIFDGGLAHTRAGEAKDEAEKARQALAALREQVRLQVMKAVAAMDEASAVIDASTEALAQADDALAIAQEGYTQGIRTNLEVLDAQLARDTARTNQAQARHDYAIAIAQLERAIGRPMEPSASDTPTTATR